MCQKEKKGLLPTLSKIILIEFIGRIILKNYA